MRLHNRVASPRWAAILSLVGAAIAPCTATRAGAQDGRAGGSDGGRSGRTVTNECAAPRPEWIWCDDFEQDRLKKYFEYEDAGGRFARVAGGGLDGSFGMRARWSSVGQVEAGALHLAFGKTPQAYFKPVDAGSAIYRDVYWRVYVKLQPGWRGGGADKLSRAISFASSTWAEAMIAHVWSGNVNDGGKDDPNYLALDPASGTDELGLLQATKYNDFAKLRWLGYTRGVTPLFADAAAGRWYCVEAHAKLNTPGQSDGLFELWLNGAPEARKDGLNWAGTFSTYGINAVFLENYWNAGAPQPEERHFDNFVVSTRRIGCAESGR